MKNLANMYVETLYTLLQRVYDYRSKRKKKHELAEVLTCLICAYCCGRVSVGRALKWCNAHLDLLREFMPLKNGIASEATVSRMLSHIDQQEVAAILQEWIYRVLRNQIVQVCIDGKALRAGTERIKDGKTPYVLNVIDADTKLVIAQFPINDKTNEKGAIPELLDQLPLKNIIFTIDAIGTQLNIMEKIVNGGGNFVLVVKRNNPSLYEDILENFDLFEKEYKKDPLQRSEVLAPFMELYTTHTTEERNRERIEYREIQACRDASFLACVREGDNPYIHNVACLRQTRIPVEKDENGEDITVSLEKFLESGSNRNPVVKSGDGANDDVQRIGLISNMSNQEMDAIKLAEIKRRHWAIENSLHYELDVVFNEDRSPAKKSKNNLALIRKFAYNILRLAIIQTEPKCGIRDMMDRFDDNPNMLKTYVFSEIKPLAA